MRTTASPIRPQMASVARTSRTLPKSFFTSEERENSSPPPPPRRRPPLSERTTPPERLVGREEPGRLVAPFERVDHSAAAVLAHGAALLRVVEQLDDPAREILGVVAPGVERGVLRRA